MEEQELVESTRDIPAEELIDNTGLNKYIEKNSSLKASVDHLKANNIGLTEIINSDEQLKGALSFLSEQNIQLSDTIDTSEVLEEEIDDSGPLLGLDMVGGSSEPMVFEKIEYDIKEDDDAAVPELDDLF